MRSIQATASSDDELRCGAKTRSGKPCESHPMKNGRCRMHGGTSTGAPRGNVNRWAHGFYSSRLRPGEHELYELAKEASIDDDIALMKVLLHGLVQASRNWETDPIASTDLIIRYVEAIRKLLLAKWVIEGGSDLASYRIA